VIAEPALRVALGSAGRSQWREEFTSKTMAARTVEVYRRALATVPS
jgi:hypothetical protein